MTLEHTWLPTAVDAPTTWLHDLRASIGDGVLQHGGPADAWLRSADAIAEAQAVHGRGIAELHRWRGDCAQAARATTDAVQECASRHAQHSVSTARTVAEACADVAACRVRLDHIARDFAAKVGPAAAASFGPAGPVPLLTLTIDHLGRALQVINETRSRLADHTRALPLPVPEPPAPPDSPRRCAPGSDSPVVRQWSRLGIRLATLSAEAMVHTAVRTLDSALRNTEGPAKEDSSLSPPARRSPSPVDTSPEPEHRRVRLPDGSIALAPNERAAKAVRAALSQHEVPYQWGANAQGKSLDGSGLTRYAYEQAGIDLPRLASDQGIGHRRIAESDVMPGDLAVWDGHVAMVVGNGEMIDTRGSVEITHIRTDNEGMRFHGFFRPTE